MKVNRHVTKAELRIIEFDDSITPRELISAVATAGGWNPEERTVGESRRRSSLSVGTMCVRCPIVVKETRICERNNDHQSGKWPYLHYQFIVSGAGHVSSQCHSEVDCNGRCISCGEKVQKVVMKCST